MKNTQLNNGTGSRRKRRLKKSVIMGAVIAGIVTLAITLFVNAVDSLFVETYEDKKKSEQLDSLHTMKATETKAVTITTTWTDSQIQDTIHKMSHQKVKASEKWGAIMMTKERITILSEIVEENKDDLYYYEVYREILDRWVEGDFSQADDDHNTVWKMQGGSVGRAEGLMSDREEYEFVKEVFDEEIQELKDAEK